MSILGLGDGWLRDFDRVAFRFTHRLADHDALQLEALREIVLSLPRDRVFASRADLKIDTDFDRAHVDHKIDQSLEATLGDMETMNSYVMVRQPDSHPRLKPVLEEFMSELREEIRRGSGHAGVAAAKATGVFHDPMLYLFLSSPNSVTPFHVDRYSTLLLQLRGEKDVMTWDRHDRDAVTEEELESLFGQPYVKNPSYKGGARSRGEHATHLRQGEGVHIPFTAPHWVRNGPAVSVSVSFICKTDESLRDANAYRFNYHARRLLSRLPSGLPRPHLEPVGARPGLDATKAGLMRGVSGIRRRISA
jgi:hypothetical protein